MLRRLLLCARCASASGQGGMTVSRAGFRARGVEDQGADEIDRLFDFFGLEWVIARRQFELGRDGERHGRDRENRLAQPRRLDPPNDTFALRCLDHTATLPGTWTQPIIAEPL